jgi:hypothetical protein
MRGLLPTGTASPLLAEAVVAVDWLVQPRFEWDLRLGTATAADGIVHDALAAAAPVAAAPAAPAAALGPSGLTAGGTALGLLIPSASVEFLIRRREGEFRAAIGAN